MYLNVGAIYLNFGAVYLNFGQFYENRVFSKGVGALINTSKLKQRVKMTVTNSLVELRICKGRGVERVFIVIRFSKMGGAVSVSMSGPCLDSAEA